MSLRLIGIAETHPLPRLFMSFFPLLVPRSSLSEIKELLILQTRPPSSSFWHLQLFLCSHN